MQGAFMVGSVMKNTRYTTKHATANFSDCTNVGWIVESHATRARFTRHSRWAGSRNSIVYLKDLQDEDGPLTEESAYALAGELDEYRDRQMLTDKKGDSHDGFRCIDAGFIVR